MKILVYFYSVLSEQQEGLIRDAAGEHQVAFVYKEEDAIVEATDAEVIFGFCPPEVFTAAKRLKWFQTESAGLDGQLFPELIESDVVETNAAGLYASHAAEHAFALLLGLTRGVHRFAENRLKRNWQIFKLIEIGGWRLGIIGMGGFGIEMAQRGKGLGLEVVAVDAYRDEAPESVDQLWGMDRLDDLLGSSDVVMIACPLTQETHHLINAEKLALLKPTSYLINVARGGVVDEEALVKILQEGRIAGAGLDVFEVEPLPPDSPLWDLENVILAPHIAGSSQHRPGRTIEFFCENLGRYLRGESLLKVVDKEKGF